MSDCRIRLRNGAREFEVAGDRLFVEEMLARFAPWVQSPDPAEVAPGVPVPAGDPPRVPSSFRVQAAVSFADFLQLKAPQSPLGRLLVLAYFLEKYQYRPAYAPDELTAWWHERWPSEPLDSQLCQEAVNEGYLEWETPEALTLTYRGQMHVRDGLA
ncbi:hypothetical protein D3C72_170920 [compost metagenome]